MEKERGEVKEIPVEVALEILFMLNTPEARAVYEKYKLDVTVLNKVPRFYITQTGEILYESKFKKGYGFIEPDIWKGIM